MKNKISTLLPIIAGALWGSVGVFVRGFTNGNIDNVSILVMRVLFAAIMMFVFIAIKDKSLLKINLERVWVFACGGIVAMFGMNFCYNNAINSLSLSLAGVLLALSPVFVMFLAAILFKEKITARSIVCMIFALIGCTMASGVIGGGEIAFSTSGILFGIAAAFFYGLIKYIFKDCYGKGISCIDDDILQYAYSSYRSSAIRGLEACWGICDGIAREQHYFYSNAFAMHSSSSISAI